MTICPASVPVSVAFWPESSRATANRTLATEVPSSGASSMYASEMSATSSCPVPWNTAAAMISMAALMNSATVSATNESMDAKRTASRLLGRSSAYFRVCTIDEWRYRLCGITVAPRIPMAMYSMPGSETMRVRGTKPHSNPAMSGLDRTSSTVNDPAMPRISSTTSASTQRNPWCCR